jgi:hypothetical protein
MVPTPRPYESFQQKSNPACAGEAKMKAERNAAGTHRAKKPTSRNILSLLITDMRNLLHFWFLHLREAGCHVEIDQSNES